MDTFATPDWAQDAISAPAPIPVEFVVDVREVPPPPDEPLTWDGSIFPRGVSNKIRSMSEAEREKFRAERHAAKNDPLRLGEVLGFDFQEQPHRELFAQMIPLPPLAADGTGPDISTLDPQFKKRMILWSRGTFKTSAVIVEIVLLILRYPDVRIMFLTGSDTLAKNQLARLRRVFEKPSPEFLRLFPEFCLTSRLNKRTHTWTDISEPMGTAKAFTVPCRTSEGSIYAEPTCSIFTPKSTKSGSHFNFIFCDDLVNDQNFRSPQMLETAYSHYLDIVPLLDPSGMMVLTGTRYSFGDPYERIQNKIHEDGESSIWKSSIRSCWTFACLNCLHADAQHDFSKAVLQPPCRKCGCIGYDKNTASKGVLFPLATTRKGKQIGWTLEFLENLRRDLGAAVFANQMENSPLAEENATFTETMIGAQTLHNLEQFPQYITPGSSTFIVGDLAYSDSEESDLSVLFCFRKWQGALWVYKSICGHFNSTQLVANVLKLLLSERPTRMYLEKNLGHQFIQDQITSTAATLGIKNVPLEFIGGASDNRKGAKEIRIRGVQQMFTSKRLWLFAGMADYQTLVNQLVKFPRGGKHGDDIADCLSLVCTAPTGWALDTPPPQQSTTSWLQKLHNSAPTEDDYYDHGGGNGLCM